MITYYSKSIEWARKYLFALLEDSRTCTIMTDEQRNFLPFHQLLMYETTFRLRLLTSTFQAMKGALHDALSNFAPDNLNSTLARTNSPHSCLVMYNRHKNISP